MNAYYLLGQHAHWNINKRLAKRVGIEAALLLSDLISKREYFIGNKDLKINDWFFNTAENIELDTTLTPHKQREAIKTLSEQGFLEVKLMGIPAKNHFKVNDIQLLKYLTTSDEDLEQQEVKNIDTNNNKEQELNNTNNNSEQKIEDLEPIVKELPYHISFAKKLLNEDDSEGAAHLEALEYQTKIKINKNHTKEFRMHLVTENKNYDKFNEWVRHFRNWLNTKPTKDIAPVRYQLNGKQ
jgi:hypothetical protein